MGGRHRRPLDRQATYGEVFGVGEFRSIWLAQALSYIGDQFAQVALAVLVYNNTHSPLKTAVAYALTYLPPIMGGPILSVLADLIPRRRVMIVCDVARAGVLALMAVQHMPFAALCALIFLSVLLGTPFTAARAALLSEVLPGDMYVVGSAINNITHQFTQMMGFLLGSAVIFAVGTHQALAVDAVTFALSAIIVVAGVRRRPAPRREARTRESLWQISRRGGRLVFGDRTLRPLVCFAWLCGFYVLPEGLAAPYAKTFGDSPFIVGLLMSAMPTGMVVGAFAYSRFVRPGQPAAPHGLDGDAGVRAADRFGAASAAVGGGRAVGAVRRRLRLPGRRQRRLRRRGAPVRAGAGVRAGPVGHPRQPGDRHPRRRRAGPGARSRARRRPGRCGGAVRGDDARDVMDPGTHAR